MAKGAIFCHVERIRQATHLVDIITEGNQKWHGNLPSFIKTAIIRTYISIIDLKEYIAYAENRSKEDPKACDKKYLVEPSASK